MKKLAAVFLILILLLTACGRTEGRFSFGAASLEVYYKSLEEIVQDSDLIVAVERTGRTKEIYYHHADFQVTDVTVNKVFKGTETLQTNTIRVLEVAALAVDDRKESGKHLLFLKAYRGPVTEDVYTVAGVYQGNLQLDKKDKLRYIADEYGGFQSFQADLEGLSLAEAGECITKQVHQTQP